jgi:glycerol-3-phosphate acyltransferase PlsX
VRIAVDAMGGDHAPAEIIEGAVAAAVGDGIPVMLVGAEKTITDELKRYRYPGDKVTIVHAPEVISMDDHPASAVRRKRDSSLVAATRLVKEGAAAAIISAGNTGAQMAAALLILGRLPGVERPGIATVIPSPMGPKVLIDSGANVDSKAGHLVRFAYMGSLYASRVLHAGNRAPRPSTAPIHWMGIRVTGGRGGPRVALLSVGSEPTKGSEAVIEAHQILAQAGDLNFVGNIEGRDFLSADVDVIVCDGFVGNVALKLVEGVVFTLTGMIGREIRRNPLRMLGGMLVKPAFGSLYRQFDYATYGGAPLLGVNGLSVICHGSSRAPAIRNAIRFAERAAQENIIECLSKG